MAINLNRILRLFHAALAGDAALPKEPPSNWKSVGIDLIFFSQATAIQVGLLQPCVGGTVLVSYFRIN